MAHELEILENGEASAFFGGGVPAWHGLGTVIEDDTVKSDEAIKLAGLDWLVEKRPAGYSVPNPTYDPPVISDADLEDDEKVAAFEVALAEYEKENPENLWFERAEEFAIVRDRDHRCFGYVSGRYKTFQNHEAFAFGDALVDSGEAKWHTAGSLKGGSLVWMLMKLPQDILIGGDADETIEQYVLIGTSHDGTACITATVTPVRVVCNNTFSLAMQGTQRKYKVRHTESMEGRLYEAREMLDMTFAYGKKVEEVGNALLNTKFSQKEYEAWMDDFLPLPEAKVVQMTHPTTKQPMFDAEGKPVMIEASERGRTMRENQREELLSVYNNTPDLENIRGTKWGAIQSLIDYSDHHREGREQKGGTPKEENRFLRIVNGNTLVQSGFDSLIKS